VLVDTKSDLYFDFLQFTVYKWKFYFILFTHIDKCLLKWIWFNTNRRYKWHCCLPLFLAWLIPESVYNDAFRTFTFSMQQCIVYMTKKIKIILINFRFQIGNDRQSKRLLANLGRILFFHFFLDKNRNTGFSSRHLLRLQKFCMNSRFRTGIFWIQWYRFDFAFILVI
jgi:hypothetical protein